MVDTDVLVVGAGLAGLVAARALRDAGRNVMLVDKSVGPGGRLATRRIDGARIDHGAQFFTVRSDEFAAIVEDWRRSGAHIAPWAHGFAQASDVRDGPDGVADTGGDGHPRYAVAGGMNALAKTLSTGLDVRAPAVVRALWARSGCWHAAITTDDGQTVVRATAVVCTPPVRQTLALLDRGATVLPSGLRADLDRVTYDPCLALLAPIDGDPGLPGPGGVQFADGPVRWMADNATKRVSSAPAVTVHASGEWSAEQYDADDGAIATTLGAWLQPWLSGASIAAPQVKRWRYARPRTTVDDPAPSTAIAGASIVFAGDAFGHARVEGAARSGAAAAQRLLDG